MTMTLAQPCSSTSTRDSAFHLAKSGVARFMPLAYTMSISLPRKLTAISASSNAARVAGAQRRREPDHATAANATEKAANTKQVGAIKLCDPGRMPAKDGGEQQPRDQKRDRRGEIEHRKPPEIAPVE